MDPNAPPATTPAVHTSGGGYGSHAADSHGGHGEPFRAEQDNIPVGPVLAGLAIVILSFLVGIFWSYKLQRREEAALGRTTEEMPGPAKHAFQYEVGLINSQQFNSETRAYTNIAQQKASLNQYGWQDRKANLAHVPIEEGIKKVTAQYGTK